MQPTEGEPRRSGDNDPAKTISLRPVVATSISRAPRLDGWRPRPRLPRSFNSARSASIRRAVRSVLAGISIKA